MALDSYTNLKAAVAEWLNRTDLTNQIPDFITLFEARLQRDLKRTTKTTTLYVSSQEVAVPADFNNPVSLRINSGTVYQDRPLKRCSPRMFGEVLAGYNGTPGRPTHYAFFNDALQFAPVPDQSYDCTMVYVTSVTPLSGSVASNTVLVEAPDLYLYGTLLQAAPFLENDERIPTWEKFVTAAIDGMNQQREDEEYGDDTGDVRLPRTFG
jgi:hypothetical protein